MADLIPMATGRTLRQRVIAAEIGRATLDLGRTRTRIGAALRFVRDALLLLSFFAMVFLAAVAAGW